MIVCPASGLPGSIEGGPSPIHLPPPLPSPPAGGCAIPRPASRPLPSHPRPLPRAPYCLYPPRGPAPCLGVRTPSPLPDPGPLGFDLVLVGWGGGVTKRATALPATPQGRNPRPASWRWCQPGPSDNNHIPPPPRGDLSRPACVPVSPLPLAVPFRSVPSPVPIHPRSGCTEEGPQASTHSDSGRLRRTHAFPLDWLFTYFRVAV